MIIYREFTKNQEFCQIIGFAVEWADLEKYDNSCVVKFHNGLRFDGLDIPKQNERGFVSVGHLKSFKKAFDANEKSKRQKFDFLMHVESLLDDFDTTINSVMHAIDALVSGRRMPKVYDNALELIAWNQEKGTGNWFQFVEYYKIVRRIEN